jgi:putative cell wall-binding protein
MVQDRSHRVARRWALPAAAGLVASLLLAVPAAPAAAQADEDVVAIVKDDELPSNAEVAVRLSESTPLPDVRRVVLSREDEFADALASGVMQADAPLLLVPQRGPVPTRVLEEIRRLGVDRATILGGDAAVTPEVEQQIAALGLAVDRRAGGSRFLTAVEIARAEAPDASTVIVARASSSNPAEPTQGFADALAAGGMAAENRWPVLLTETAALHPDTRAHIAASPVERVLIVGGTAAVSAEVEAELRTLVADVDRIAGPSRAETAVEVAKELGADDVSEVDRVVLVDGTSPNGFAGGFAAAAHSAHFDAPILLADGVQLPPATAAFLEPGAAFAQRDPVELTCVVHPLACDGGREALGLVDFPLLSVDPPINSLVQPGQVITLRLDPADEGAGQPVTVKGSCLDQQVDVVTDGAGEAQVQLSSALAGETCSMAVVYGTETDLLEQGFTYALTPDRARVEGGIDIASEVFSYGATTTSTPIYLTDTISCDGPAGPLTAQSSAYEAKYVDESFGVHTFNLSSVPVTALPGDTCTVTAQVPDGIGRVLWGLYSWSDAGLRSPLLLGSGTTATFSFDALGTEVTDVDVVWILETNQPDIGTPPPPAGGEAGRVFNPEDLPVTCGGALVGPGFTTPGPGAPCEATSGFEGVDVLVVAPGVPVAPAPAASFAAPASAEVAGVYSFVTDAGAQTSCQSAPALDYTFLTFGATTPAAPVAHHLFEGFEGESIRFRVDALVGDPTIGLDPTLAVYAPSGALVGSNDDGLAPDGSPETLFDSRLDLVLPETGVYCVEVAGYGGSTGDYAVAADPAPAFAEAGVLEPGEVRTYPLEIGPDEVAVLEARAPGFEPTDPVMRVLDASGAEVAASDDDAGVLNARIELEAPPGSYVVEITTFDGAGGPYLYEAAFATFGTAFAARPGR